MMKYLIFLIAALTFINCSKKNQVLILENEKVEEITITETIDNAEDNTTNKMGKESLSNAGGDKCYDPTRAKHYVKCDLDKRGPVCGCNNITYSNACEADKAGVNKYNWGKCLTTNTAIK